MTFLALRPGDPTPVGYLTVVWYAVAAWGCWRVARIDRDSAKLWWLLFALMAACGVNKQLDLQTVLTEVGRYLAHRESWYDQRRTVQLCFVVALVGIGSAGGLILLRRAKVRPWPTRLAMAGAVVLMVFIMVRAASFHHVDLFLAARWGGVGPNAVLELGGISLVLAGAEIRRRQVLGYS